LLRKHLSPALVDSKVAVKVSAGFHPSTKPMANSFNFAVAGASAFRLFNLLTSHPVSLHQVGVAVAVKFFVTDFLRGGMILESLPFIMGSW
jgi:hypothetical protein